MHPLRFPVVKSATGSHPPGRRAIRGSIAEDRRSDAAAPLLPTVAKLMDVELAGEGVLSLIIHPGHVQFATHHHHPLSSFGPVALTARRPPQPTECA